MYAVQPLERFEQLLCISGVETGTIVAHHENRRAAGVFDAEFDACAIAMSREFPGIAQQVFQCHAQQLCVTDCAHVRGGDDIDLPVRLRLSQLAHDLAGHRR